MSLTPVGRQVVADSVALRRRLTRVVLDGWDISDVETLTRLTNRLADTVAGHRDALSDQLARSVDPPP